MVSLVALLLAAATPVMPSLERGASPQAQADDPPIHERWDRSSLAACGGCHLEAFEQWSRSLHAGAWTNQNVRTATRDFSKKSCRPCHSPLPVLISGLDRRPEFREVNTIDGVHCLSCHGLDTGVAAARTIEGAPCRPVRDPRIQSADLCFPCHEPTHGAFTEYRESDAFALGLRCSDCHMQVDEEGRHDHGPNGGKNPEFVKRALGWSCKLVERELHVELRNRAGHRFPGEIPSRSFVLKVQFDDGEPEVLTLRKPHKGEQREDDRLAPDETRVLRFQAPQAAREVRVRLLFLPLPLLPEESAFLLGEWSGTL